MKSRIISLVLLAATLVVSGCESLPSPVRSRLDPPAVMRVVAAPMEKVYFEAQAALRGIGYRLVRTSIADGTIEAVSAVTAATGPRDARQLRARLTLSDRGPEGTAVAVVLWEALEEESARGQVMATERPVAGPGEHEGILAAIERRLGGS